MALVKINGQPLSAYGGTLLRPSLEITKTDREPNSCRFTVEGYRPAGQSDVQVWNSAGSVLIFGGIVRETQQRRIGRGADHGVEYDVSCGGYVHLLQRHLLVHRFPAQTAGATIKEAVALFDGEIDTSLVDDGTQLPAIAWSDYPMTLIDQIAKLIGYHWEVDEYKRLIFRPRGTTVAPAPLTPTGTNFTDLEVIWDDQNIRNVVVVKGGYQPSDEVITDTATGNGIGDKFRLSYEPFANTQNPLVRDTFSPEADYHATPAIWVEYDTTNPTPPNQPDSGKIPFTGSDGYVIQDNFQRTGGVARQALQLVGGPGTWGQIGVVSKGYAARQELRYFAADLTAHLTGNGIVGFFDGIGVADTDCLHGVRFEASGFLHIQENGARIALTAKSYAIETTYAIRITLKAAGGAKYEIQGGTYGAFGSTAWTVLRDSTSGTAATLYAGVAGNSLNCSIYEIKVADPVRNITVTVNGVAQIVGLEDVDNAHVDCLVNPKYQLIRFFNTNVPPNGAALVFQYNRPRRIIAPASDGNSIHAIKVLTGETGPHAGRREYQLKDETIDSLQAARERAITEVALYSNPIITAEWETEDDGYAPGQVIRVDVPQRNLAQSFLINDVGYSHFNGDNYVYRIRAGSTLKGLDSYLVYLLRLGKRVDFEAEQSLDFIVTGDDLLYFSEVRDKLTTIPDMDGLDGIELGETLDDNTVGPFHLPPYVYGLAQYGRAIYEV